MATPKKKRTAKKANIEQSFVRSPNPKPFIVFQFTQQTAYWIVIGILILGLGIWVVYLTVRVHTLYDTVELKDANTSLTIPMDHKKK